jgi:hypothetical protein
LSKENWRIKVIEVERTEKRMQKLQELYAEIRTLNDELPADVAKKILLYNRVLLLIGDFWAEAVEEYGITYAERKKVGGDIKAGYNGTGVEKEGAAEAQTYEMRVKEAKAEALVTKWKAQFEATKEMIQSLKIHLKMLAKELDLS